MKRGVRPIKKRHERAYWVHSASGVGGALIPDECGQAASVRVRVIIVRIISGEAFGNVDQLKTTASGALRVSEFIPQTQHHLTHKVSLTFIGIAANLTGHRYPNSSIEIRLPCSACSRACAQTNKAAVA